VLIRPAGWIDDARYKLAVQLDMPTHASVVSSVSAIRLVRTEIEFGRRART
jgi:hypothetical protein